MVGSQFSWQESCNCSLVTFHTREEDHKVNVINDHICTTVDIILVQIGPRTICLEPSYHGGKIVKVTNRWLPWPWLSQGQRCRWDQMASHIILSYHRGILSYHLILSSYHCINYLILSLYQLSYCLILSSWLILSIIWTTADQLGGEGGCQEDSGDELVGQRTQVVWSSPPSPTPTPTPS